MSQVVDKPRRLPWILGVFGVAACLFAFLPQSSIEWLQYDRQRILDGEIWRMFTGHFVHWNTSHLVWDVAVFFACGLFLEWIRRGLALVVLAVGPWAISGALLLLQPDMYYYRGLSALDMSLFAGICLQAIGYCRLRQKSELIVIWGFALASSLMKPFLELALGGTLFVSHFGEGIQASPLAHLLGVLLAVVMFKTISFWETALSCPTGCIRSFRNRRLSESSIS